MNTPSNAVPQAAQHNSSVTAVPPRPLYWSVRRELWENRSIYMAPAIAAGLIMLGFLISLHGLSLNMREIAGLDPMLQAAVIARPFSHTAMLLILTGIVVGVFYCLDALHAERRDRSILFWKSLPVSDLTTVLSKVMIPLVVLPLLVFATAVVLQVIMLLLSSMVLASSGVGASILWSQLPFVQMDIVLLYALIVLALWHAPIYGWLLLVSGWARRTTFLWAILPLVAIPVVEGIAFHTSYFGSLLKDRLFGFAGGAFDFVTPSGAPIDPHFIPLSALTPGRFLASPGLWIGLILAAAFLAAAVRLRRYREPI